MSDVQFSPGMEAPEVIRVPQRSRRFSRRASHWPLSQRRPEAITESDSLAPVRIREGLYRRSLGLADALSALVALSLIVVWNAGASFEPWVLAAMPVVVLVSKISGLYERDELVLNKTTLDEAPKLLQIAGLFALLVFLGQNRFVHAAMTSQLVAELWLATFGMLFLGRVAARLVAARIAAVERCLVVGDPAAITAVRGKLEGSTVKAKVVASIRLDALVPRIDPNRFVEIVAANDVHRVIIAPIMTTDTRDMLDLVRVAKQAGTRVSLLPRVLEVVGSSVEFDHLDGLTMLGVRRFGLTRSSRALKRALDLAGSTLMLLAIAPIAAAVALAIRLDSKGPILFRQTRVGRDGERFQILKFRTMVPEAEQLKGDLLHLNETQGLFKIADDPRITRVGRLLRRTALDELPQLLNVWRGEMSLVGPRPLVVDEDAKIEGLDRSRLHLTPGMTGHWQILGSAKIPLHEMVGIDYLYVANWSLWTDQDHAADRAVHARPSGGIALLSARTGYPRSGRQAMLPISRTPPHADRRPHRPRLADPVGRGGRVLRLRARPRRRDRPGGAGGGDQRVHVDRLGERAAMRRPTSQPIPISASRTGIVMSTAS
ncbi:MAG: exopolysaccharide biosynthesis polyprenyl glycosylphosphotransferase, partial [Thermoleophilia bacterium]|nr:exopolysaccharide biosynthesis polyprenyl glycosylphosphotransferase [Thermoleophilia bacterium]